MSQNISRNIRPQSKLRIKDSLLLIIIFCIGLAGLCYILHMSASKNEATGYQIEAPSTNASEVIYFTSNQ